MMLYPRHAIRRQYNGPPWLRLDTPCARKGGRWMHGEYIFRSIINFNAHRRYFSAPLPAQRISGLSYGNIFLYYEFSHSGGKQVFFEYHAHKCTHFPAQGVCRYGHGECNNRYMLAAPPMLLASLPSLRGGRSYRRASGHSRCPVTTSYPPFPAQGV